MSVNNNVLNVMDSSFSFVSLENETNATSVNFNQYVLTANTPSASLENRVKIYNEMIQFMATTPQAKEQLNAKLNKLPASDKIIQQIAFALENQDWKCPHMSNPKFPYYVLAGLRNGSLSVEQFFISIMFWSLKKEFKEVQAIPLFNENGFINDEAYHIVKETFTFQKNDIILVKDLNLASVSEEIDLFFKTMAQKEKSSQQLFTVSNPEPKTQDKETVVDQILKRSFNIFMYSGKGEERKGLMPSLPMLQEFLNIRYPHPVKMIPIIDVVSAEYIKTCGLEGTRPLSIPFEGVHLPVTADGNQSPTNDTFVLHDVYHGALASCIPHKESRAIITVADIFEEIASYPHFSSIKPFIIKAQQFLIDMEAHTYRIDLRHEFEQRGYSNKHLFWLQIDSHVKDALKFNSLNKPKDEIKIEFYTLFFKRILENKREFKQLGISFKPLSQLAEMEVTDQLKRSANMLNLDFNQFMYDEMRNNFLIQGYFAHSNYKEKKQAKS